MLFRSLGDLFDFYNTSRYGKYRLDFNAKIEIDMYITFLEHLRELFPTQRIIFTEGNHEMRWRDYMVANAPKLYGIPLLELNELLGFTKHRIEFVTNNRIVKIGKMSFHHGNKHAVGTVNPARNLFTKTKCNFVIGDKHKTRSYIQTAANGTRIETHVLGCLCHLSQEYLPESFNEWNQGFGYMINKEDDFEFKNIRIEKGNIIE